MTVFGFFKKIAVIAALALFAASWVAAQGPMRCCAQGGVPRYDTSTEATLAGTVEEVKQLSHMRMAGTGTHLMLKTNKETIEVLLGPTNFLASNQFTFAKGDQVEVTGSRVKFGDGEAIVAREVKKGNKTLTLRDAKGIPQWSRGRWRQ